jgi:hypothetical protein
MLNDEAKRKAKVAEILESLTKARLERQKTQAKLEQSESEMLAELLDRPLTGRGFHGKRVTIELLDGKHDGLTLDSESGDATEREIVRFLRSSPAFDVIQVVESDTEAYMQLKPKKPDQSS